MPTPEAMSSSDEDIALSKKKKKKKTLKKRVDSDDEDSGAEEAQKPQKEAKAKAETAAPSPTPNNGDSDFETLDEFYAHLKTCTKKKKKKESDEVQAVSGDVNWEKFQGNDTEYTYPEILRLVVDRIKSNNPSLGVNQKTKIRPPQVQRDGTKKVAFTNFAEICKSLSRPQEHLFAFILAELGTSGNIDGQQNLIIKGRLTSKHIEGLLRKYIEAYVTCGMCKGVDTNLIKDPHTRLTTLQCNQCNASRTVQSITGGFSAQIGRRKRK